MGKGDKKGAASSKAAQAMLAKDGGSFGGFSGRVQGGFSFGSSYLASTHTADDQSSSSVTTTLAPSITSLSLDGELAQCIQRLSKRDAITRAKALQTLKGIISSNIKQQEDFKELLSPWSYSFKKLVMDSSRQVRAEACNVMGALAGILGREIAPYLKTLMPSWYLATHDNAPEVAQAAKISLNSAFPGEKMKDALVFCRVEVIHLLAENLKSTPQTLGDPRKESKEELQERYDRIVAISCITTASLLETFCHGGMRSNAVQDVILGIKQNILQQNSFLKTTLQSKSSSVRGSAYRLVAILSECNILCDQDETDTNTDNVGTLVRLFAPVVLCSFSEIDPSVHSALWDMILSFCKAYPTSWDYVAIHKAALPRFYAFLRHGCYGSAETSFPAVLPCIDLMPASLTTSVPFYDALLNNALIPCLMHYSDQQSLNASAGYQSVNDASGVTKAAVDCFIDCFIYGALKIKSACVDGDKFVKTVACPFLTPPEHSKAYNDDNGDHGDGGDTIKDGTKKDAKRITSYLLGDSVVCNILGGLMSRLADIATKQQQLVLGIADQLGAHAAAQTQLMCSDRRSDALEVVCRRVLSMALSFSSQQQANNAALLTAVSDMRERVLGPTRAVLKNYITAHQDTPAIQGEISGAGLIVSVATSLLASFIQASHHFPQTPITMMHQFNDTKGKAITMMHQFNDTKGKGAVVQSKASYEDTKAMCERTINSLLDRCDACANTEQEYAAIQTATRADCRLFASSLREVALDQSCSSTAAAEVLSTALQRMVDRVLQNVHNKAYRDAVQMVVRHVVEYFGYDVAALRSSSLDFMCLNLLVNSSIDVTSHATLCLDIVKCIGVYAQENINAVKSSTLLAESGYSRLLDALNKIYKNTEDVPTKNAIVDEMLIPMLVDMDEYRESSSVAESKLHASLAVLDRLLNDDDHIDGIGTLLASFLENEAVVNVDEVADIDDDLDDDTKEYLKEKLTRRLFVWTEGAASANNANSVVSFFQIAPKSFDTTTFASALAHSLASSHLQDLAAAVALPVFRVACQIADYETSCIRALTGTSSSSPMMISFLNSLLKENADRSLVHAIGSAYGYKDILLNTSDVQQASALAISLLKDRLMVLASYEPVIKKDWMSIHKIIRDIVSITASGNQEWHSLLDASLHAAWDGLVRQQQQFNGGNHSSHSAAQVYGSIVCRLLHMALQMSFNEKLNAIRDTLVHFLNTHVFDPELSEMPMQRIVFSLHTVTDDADKDGGLYDKEHHLSFPEPLRGSDNDDKNDDNYASPSSLLVASGLPQYVVALCQQLALEKNDGKEKECSLQCSLLNVLLPCPLEWGFIQKAMDAEYHKGTQRSQYNKGESVWYWHSAKGEWEHAEILAVDSTVSPPSYTVLLSTGSRETEASRLRSGSSSGLLIDRYTTAAAAAPPYSHEMRCHVLPMRSEYEERRALMHVLRSRPLSADQEHQQQHIEERMVDEINAVCIKLAVAYCDESMFECTGDNNDWSRVFSFLDRCSAFAIDELLKIIKDISCDIVSLADDIVGTRLDGGVDAALSFFRNLNRRGVLASTVKGTRVLETLHKSFEAALWQFEERFAKVLHDAMYVYSSILTNIAPCSKTLPLTEWHAAQAAFCLHVLQTLLLYGALVSLISDTLPTGNAAKILSSSKRDGSHHIAVWNDIACVARATLAHADLAFLHGVVDAIDRTLHSCFSSHQSLLPFSCDCVDMLLALILTPHPHTTVKQTAYTVLLSHPLLMQSLSMYGDELSDKSGMNAADCDTGYEGALDKAEEAEDECYALMEMGVRYQLSAVVTNSGHDMALVGWSILLAHLLDMPSESSCRQMLVQCIKDCTGNVVSDILDTVAGKLTLQDRERADKKKNRNIVGPSSDLDALVINSEDTSSSQFAQNMMYLFNQGVGISAESIDHFLEEDHTSQQGTMQQTVHASLLFAAMLRTLPVPCRLWFTNIRDRSMSMAIEKFTARGISGGLLTAEFDAVERLASSDRDSSFTIRAKPTEREVIASLEIEEGHMIELVVKLPEAMPLRAAEAQCKKSVGINEARLRTWLLSITSFIRNRNDATAGAIRMWKKNIEKEFEGQENCLICFSIIHPSTGQIPKSACRTCRQRFHGACLYKWFHSSGKSNCPHCQSPW